MKRALKSVLLSLVIIVVQIILYKIYFDNGPPEIQRSRLYKDFPNIPANISKSLANELFRLNSSLVAERLGGITEIEKMGDKASSAVPFLVFLVRDADVGVRTRALYVLDEMGDKRALTGFVAALGDTVPEVRKSAAVYLRKLGDERAIEPLILTLEDSEWDVKFEAAYTLKELTGQDFGVNQERWKNYLEEKRSADEPK